MSDGQILEGDQVKEYLENHPECMEKLQGVRYQFALPKTFSDDEVIERPLEVSDIERISFKGWDGQAGVFAWYYPCGIPHYTKIG